MSLLRALASGASELSWQLGIWFVSLRLEANWVIFCMNLTFRLAVFAQERGVTHNGIHYPLHLGCFQHQDRLLLSGRLRLGTTYQAD